MSNICYSDWVIEGEASEIQDLYNKLTNEISNNAYTELIPRYDKSPKWLGNVVAYFGGDNDEIKCWGTFYNVLLDDKGNLTFSTYTDNNDMAETWYFVCSKYKTLKVFYYSEETAASGIWTNDKEGRYFQAGWQLKETDNYNTYQTKEEAMQHLSEILKKPVTTLDDIDCEIDSFNDLMEREDININIMFTEIFLVNEKGEYIGPDMDAVRERLQREE